MHAHKYLTVTRTPLSKTLYPPLNEMHTRDIRPHYFLSEIKT